MELFQNYEYIREIFLTHDIKAAWSETARLEYREKTELDNGFRCGDFTQKLIERLNLIGINALPISISGSPNPNNLDWHAVVGIPLKGNTHLLNIQHYCEATNADKIIVDPQIYGLVLPWGLEALVRYYRAGHPKTDDNTKHVNMFLETPDGRIGFQKSIEFIQNYPDLPSLSKFLK